MLGDEVNTLQYECSICISFSTWILKPFVSFFFAVES